MKGILVLCVAAAFWAAGYGNASAKSIDIYTFKKDRVDQEIKGNQGYLLGNPPAPSVEKSVAKRTLIGIDIELPGCFSGKDNTEEPVRKEEAVTEEEVWIK
ncbi:MAG: hypothetical protein ABIA77_04915 [Candidatus Omnitrophota bacterium]